MPAQQMKAKSIDNIGDVVIVGAGPAGSATALELSRRGYNVVLLDKSTFPRYKTCAEYTSPEVELVLQRLGVWEAVERSGQPRRIPAMTIIAPGGARFRAAFAESPSPHYALGISRFVLDRILVEEARARGVEVRERFRVGRLLYGKNGAVAGVAGMNEQGEEEEIGARVVVGADGLHSLVAKTLGVTRKVSLMQRIGLVTYYEGLQGLEALDSEGEMHIGGHYDYCGVAPLPGGVANVALVTPLAEFKAWPGRTEDYFAARVARIPSLAARLAQGRRSGPLKGVGPLAHRVTRASGAGWLLAGDAAGFLDPFTGEGVYKGLRSGEAAGEAIAAALRQDKLPPHGFHDYDLFRRHELAPKNAVTLLVQLFVSHGPLMNYVTDRLQRRPALGATLTAVLGDYGPASAILDPRYLLKLLRP